MAVVKVIELLGESGESWEDATRQVVAEATKTLHGVTSVYVKEFQATVENDKVKNFRVDAKSPSSSNGSRAERLRVRGAVPRDRWRMCSAAR